MQPVVLDCSLVVGWCFEDERHPLSEQVRASLDKTPGIVPSIWPMEVANVLAMAERKNRLTRAQAIGILGDLRLLPIEADIPDPDAIERVLAIAGERRLSAYDAAYLELATRRSATLATLGERLLQAATDACIPLVSRIP